MNLRSAFERVPKQVKASFVILLSSFINSAMNMITTPIFTRLLTTAEYGTIAQYNSWLNIITVFATLSLSGGVFQVAMNEFPEQRDSFTFSAVTLSNICTCAIFAIILMWANYFSSLFQLEKSLLYLMFFYLLFNPAMSLWLSRQRYELNYRKVAAISIGSAVLSQVVAILVVVFADNNINKGVLKLISSYGTGILFSVGIYLSIAIKAKWKPRKRFISYAYKFNITLIPHYLSQYILTSSDKIMITHYLSEAATGIYSLATTVSNISMLAWSAISASLTPFIYDNLNKKNYIATKKTANIVVIVFAACCVVVSLTGPEIVLLLGSENYRDGIQMIPPIAASCLLSAVYSFYSSIAFYHHKTISTSIMTMIAAATNIALNMVLIPQYGAVAAAYTTEAAYLLYTGLHFYNYRRISKTARVFNDSIVWIIIIIATILCIGSALIYDYWVIRYGLVLTSIIFAVAFRKKLRELAIIRSLRVTNNVDEKRWLDNE